MNEHLWLPYCQMKTAPLPIKIVATEGEHLILEDGRRIIDGIASWWTACHGYNHPYIADAVSKQLGCMPHVMMGGVCHDPALQVSASLASILPGSLDKVFLCDSGSVAVEVALKIAAQYWINRGARKRNRFVSFENAYHGDTTGAMSVCDPVDSMHSHFKGFLLEQFPSRLPNTDDDFIQFEQFVKTKKEVLAGVIIEPLAQIWGMQFHSPEQLRRIANCCKRNDLLLIADEIATGFGRTGSMFAVEQADVVPDIICVGKALTGGTMTLAATVATREIYSAFHSDSPEHALMHGPTFMGNPLACSAANASIELFEKENRLEDVQRVSHRFKAAAIDFSKTDLIARSLGAIFVLEFPETLDMINVRDFFLERDIWLRPIRNVLYLCPPLNMSDDSLNKIFAAMQEFVDSKPY